MDFELSDEEVALGESMRGLCATRFPLALVQEAAERPGGSVDPRGLAALASAGVFSLQVPEADGGVGLGMGPSTIVFEELGRALVPGPLVSTHLAAREGTAAFEGAAEGKRFVGSVRLPGASGPEALPPLLVADLGMLDALVLVGDDALKVVHPSDIDASRVDQPLDPLTPLWRVRRLPVAETVGDTDDASRWRRDESILVGAFLVGLAAKCVEMAVGYAMEREQFGRPIGSFQAVKHICADMLVRAETARVAVQAAAVTVDQPDVGDSERAAAGAAMLAAEAATANAKACVQVHGGMGFTWEVPAHLFLMRGRVLSQQLGTRGALAETVAERY